MRKFALITCFLCFFADCVAAQGTPKAQAPQQKAQPPVVVFWEDGFPAADMAAPVRAELAAVPNSFFASSEQLSDALARAETRLLVLPFGSTFPEEQWPAIFAFLERGGNLSVLGGQPFTRPAYREEKIWKLRAPTLAFAQKLFINEYQSTPGSRGLQFQPNKDVPQMNLPAFDWARAFSLTIRLSDEDLYPRGGSAGSINARLTPLAWGTSSGRRLSAPAVQIDHLQNNFVSGRWIFLACDLPAGFFSAPAGRQMISLLVRQALDGAEDFAVRPAWPLFLSGEPLTLQVRWQRFSAQPSPVRLEVEVAADGRAPQRESFPLAPGQFPFTTQVTLPASAGKGLHRVTARLYEGSTLRCMYRTGFWLRDEQMLNSGPRVTVNENFFEIDGRTQAILGTTYMASDVQREFFLRPNVYVWDRDLTELRAAGFNMLRTGWWSAWDQITKDGVVHEEMLRALEAFLLTARAHNFPVQFTFFSFIPEVLGGANAYLDPEALRRQKELLAAVVERFKDVPYLSWDLINEPSFANPNQLWMTRPNRDKFELAAWNEWLRARYASRAALAEAWQTVLPAEPELLPLPANEEFATGAAYRTMRGSNALKTYDYFLFAQEKFRAWVEQLRDAIRATGSEQLVTVGQDEGGVRDRLSPAFFGDALDFTTNHTWWLLDDLLWDSLAAKQPGKPLLIQETGISRQLQMDASARRSLEQDAHLLERKLAVALSTSAGAIHWLWHINSYMRDDNEAAIGAIRADGTEKPEAEVLRKFAKFAVAASASLSRPEEPQVVIVTSQAFQYSALNWLALEAQTKAVRALHSYCRVPGAVLAENQLARLGNPKLVILPSPHALNEESWQALLKYVESGGNLLVTGSVERDAHWRATQRLAALGLEAAIRPITFRQAKLDLGTEKLELSFAFEKQQFAEALAIADGKTFHELRRGRGRIFLASYPVELAEGVDAAAVLYARILSRLGIEPPFLGQRPSPGVLIRPVIMQDAILYLLVSESARNEDIAIQDRLTGAEIRLRLPPQRAALVLLDKRNGRVIASSAF
ncbi:MAG: hypothetical protein M1453_00120 [Acidobacteria bacterium]|nr:hypothetical protein [Acidobacteriota bacterium]MCL5286393.1 hypothetical protein [Acidobacteriota bacterium]